MPKDLIKRGRRGENKRKREENVDDDIVKKPRVLESGVINENEYLVDGNAEDGFIQFDTEQPNNVPNVDEKQFYGLLDEDEQKYYANVNVKLSANDFETNEERDSFIQAVYRESQGKEMRLASSQSCSRYLEKVIMLSTCQQLKQLFKAFLENLTYLVQHRFGSHCCETLFIQAAKLLETDTNIEDESENLEALYLRAVEQLEPNIGFLLTERFASHSIRVLLLVLSGEPLEDESTKNMLASRKKEKLEVADIQTMKSDVIRKVPKSFSHSLNHMITVGVSSLDTTYLRALATHPTGNPVLQLLLRLELTANEGGKNKVSQGVFKKLFPDQELEADSESGKFISGLLYDPSGSHLVETLVQYLPGKPFKKLYKNLLRDKIGNLAKNDVASYVAIRILERLGKDDLKEAVQSIQPELSDLITRHRTGVIKTLVERSAVRNLDVTDLAASIQSSYGGDPTSLLTNMMRFDVNKVVDDTKKDEGMITKSTTNRTDVHGSLLAQAMLQAETTCEIIQESILAQSPSTILLMAKDPIASRALQIALKSSVANKSFQRKFIPMIFGHMAEMATDAASSHVADALWEATNGSQFLKERLANELKERESFVRESRYGRTVWKNWSMDMYQTRYREWQALARGYSADEEKISQVESGKPSSGKTASGKTALQLARERFAQKQSRRPAPGTGSNRTAIVSTNA